LVGNFPNPFNPETTIKFNTARAGNVTIDIFNIRGQKIKTIANDNFGVGLHRVVWDGADSDGRKVASGVYFYRMTTGEFTQTRRMLLMK